MVVGDKSICMGPRDKNTEWYVDGRMQDDKKVAHLIQSIFCAWPRARSPTMQCPTMTIIPSAYTQLGSQSSAIIWLIEGGNNICIIIDHQYQSYLIRLIGL